jgi:predicted ferric reductase
VIAAALTQSKEVWYLMRGSGLIALVLLSLTVMAGVINVRRFATPQWPRAVSTLLHRNISLLAVVFLGVHVATAALDSYVPVGWLASVVPFTSGWDRFWVALGTAAVDLMIAVVATSLLRARLTRRTWRAVHWLAYAAWPLALMHGFAAGTDSGTAWARSVYLASFLAVVAALVWRLWPRPSSPSEPIPARYPSTATRKAVTIGGRP